ncbi:hypothetical protein BBJ28_00018283 [Nothophytophthora sp. Chile5]|nr:hypothetical protein BBJ28_00018283 [Nothophytophthora sp. Chile5]
MNLPSGRRQCLWEGEKALFSAFLQLRSLAPNVPILQQGLDQFLSDLTRQRDALDSSQRHVPLDVCIFCVQFLPSTYHDSSATDEEHLAGFAAAGRPSTTSSSRRRGHPTRSSLVIQHQFPSKSTARDSPSKTPRPTEPPTYRLLSSDATRVLRIESPAAALHSVATTTASYPQSTDLQHHHGLLAATDVMRDLRAQEAQQGAAILHAERGKREIHYRRRASAALATQEAAGHNSERVSGGSAMSEAQHQNIVQLLKNGGAASLYSGVAFPQQSSKPTARTSLVAGAARVVTRKHDRHFRSELLFPPVARGTHASQSKRLT